MESIPIELPRGPVVGNAFALSPLPLSTLGSSEAPTWEGGTMK